MFGQASMRSLHLCSADMNASVHFQGNQTIAMHFCAERGGKSALAIKVANRKQNDTLI